MGLDISKLASAKGGRLVLDDRAGASDGLKTKELSLIKRGAYFIWTGEKYYGSPAQREQNLKIRKEFYGAISSKAPLSDKPLSAREVKREIRNFNDSKKLRESFEKDNAVAIRNAVATEDVRVVISNRTGLVSSHCYKGIVDIAQRDMARNPLYSERRIAERELYGILDRAIDDYMGKLPKEVIEVEFSYSTPLRSASLDASSASSSEVADAPGPVEAGRPDGRAQTRPPLRDLGAAKWAATPESRQLFWTPEFLAAVRAAPNNEERCKLIVDRHDEMERAIDFGAECGLHKLIAMRLVDKMAEIKFDKEGMLNIISSVELLFRDIDKLFVTVKSKGADKESLICLADEIGKFKANLLLDDEVGDFYLSAHIGSPELLAIDYPNIVQAMSQF